ncbi:MAG: retroviral-like aspartic protease family protein [Acidobacteriota bacterium]
MRKAIQSHLILGFTLITGPAATSLTAAAPADWPIQEVPFKLLNRHMVVVEATLKGGHSLHLMIDTGATHSVVDQAVVDQLELKIVGSHRVEAFGKGSDQGRVVLRGLQVGTIRTSLLAFVAELPWSGVDGILGLDLLSQTNFTIDYSARKIRFGPRDSHFNSTTPFEFHSSQIIVPVRIEGQDVRLRMDTGARTINLYRSKMHKSIRKLRIKLEIPFTHVSGTSKYQEVALPKVELSGSQWEYVTARLMVFYNQPPIDHPYDGVLGLGELDIKRIYFDFQSNVLSWEK